MVSLKDDELRIKAELYTQDRFPLLNLQGGIGVLKDHYTSIVKLGGIDQNLRTADGCFNLMHLIASFHDYLHKQGVAFQYVYHGRKRPIDEITSRYPASRRREQNPDIQRLSHEDEVFLIEQGEKAPPYKRDYYLVLAQPRNVRRADGTFDMNLIRKGTWVKALRDGMSELYYAILKIFTGKESPRRVIEVQKDKRDRAVPNDAKVALEQLTRQAISAWHRAGSEAHRLGQEQQLDLFSDLLGGQRDIEQPPLVQIYGSLDEEPWEYLKITPAALGEKARYIAVLATRQLPQYVTMDYLSPLVAMTEVGEIQIAVHYAPLADEKVLRKIESEVEKLKQQKRLSPDAVYWRQSLSMIEGDIRGHTGHCYGASIVVTVIEDNPEKLKHSLNLVYGEMQVLGLGPCVQTLDFFRGYVSTLPFGDNALLENKKLTGSFEQNALSDSTACLLPLSVVEFYHPGPRAVYYGQTNPYKSVVYVDPGAFSEVRHKGRFGMTGSGKTQGEVILCARELATDPDIEEIVVDPKGGWENLCAEVGGVQVDYRYARINLLDRWAGGNMMPLQDKLTFLNGAFGLLTRGAGLAEAELPANSQALRDLYQHFERGEDASLYIRAAFYGQSRYHKDAGHSHYTVGDDKQAARLDIELTLARAAQLKKQLWADYGIEELLSALVSRPSAPPAGRKLRYDERGQVEEEYLSRPQALPEDIYAVCWEAYYNDSELKKLLTSLNDWEREQVLRTLLLEYRYGTPTLFDHLIYLFAHGGKGAHLAYLLSPYVDPQLYGSTYDGLTDVDIADNRFVLFSLNDVPKAQKAFAIYNVLGFVWNRMVDTVKPRHLRIDEFTYLLDQGVPEIADFAELVALGGRAFDMALTLMAQTPLALERTPQGREILANLAILEIGLQPDEGTRKAIGVMFNLSDGETEALGQLEVGDSLFIAGRDRTIVHYEISARELELYSTSVEGKKVRQQRATHERVREAVPAMVA